MTVGFIGLGLMGIPMVSRLLEAGLEVGVWNRTPAKVTVVEKLGAVPYASPAELTQAADIICLCLANTQAVMDVVFGEHGVASAGNKNKLLIDLSSSEPQATQNYAEKLLAQCAMPWVDAPVSGGVVGAEEGSLAIMVGGEADAVATATTVLKHLGQRITHMGAVGTGQVTKVCNQMIVSCNALVIAEMTALAEKSGVNAGKIASALQGGFADSKPLQILGPQMATRTFEPIKWHVRTLQKDLDMAAQLAQSQSAAIPMSALAGQLMRTHGLAGFAEKDPATLIKLYESKQEEG